ncbi:hypothetical protein [Rhodoferax sp.]|uniref:hypothetical protein n=1 Tax=Rhodoferax sp. TaxID=50421 RepID=UPI00260949F3|nr:hypothetical protein [Rhodoferax sp.]MDD2920242.1 hypothetical protein [Rhodoferax sp.]
MKKQWLALSFMLVAGAVTAQTAPVQPVAKIVATEGLVTIGYQDTLRSAVVDMRLFEGARVMNTTTGTAEIVFDSGCRITLKPGEVFNVSDANCKSLVASRARALPLVVAAAAAGAGAAGASSVLLGAAVVSIGTLVAGEKQSGS